MRQWETKLLKWDAKYSKALHIENSNSFIGILLKFFAHSGDSWFWLTGLIAVFFFAGSEWRQRVLFLSGGLIIMAVIVILLKFAIRRPRPEGDWGQIYRITDPHSFPSGHAARSAALAVMGLAVGPPWFAILLILWAPWVGIARVALGVHYFSDILAGWLIGGSMGLLAIALKPQLLQVFNTILARFMN